MLIINLVMPTPRDLLRMPISIEYVFPILAVPINTNIYSNTCCSGTRTRLLKAAYPSSSRRNVLKEAQNINKPYRSLVKIAQNCSKMRKFAQICARFVENGETKLKSACFAGPTNQHLFQYLLFMFSIPQYQYLLRLNSILIGILSIAVRFHLLSPQYSQILTRSM